MSEQVKMMTVGGGNRRALVDHMFPLNGDGTSSSAYVTTKSANYTLTQAESGCAFANNGAVTFTLPSTAEVGTFYDIFKETNHTVTISGAVNGGSSIANSSNEPGAAVIRVVAVTTTTWRVMFKTGTWA